MAVTWKDRVLSALASGAMVMSLAPAPVLADPDPNTNKAGAQASAATLDSTTPDPGYSLTVSGLESGDSITYYRIIEQDGNTTKPDRIGTQKWKLSKIVDQDGDGKVDGSEVTVDDMVIDTYTMNETSDTVTSDTRQLTPAMVNAIAAAVTNNLKNGVTAKSATGTVATGSDSYTVANAESGLYMFVAVPALADNGTEPDYMYKPIFASTDYYNTVSKPEDATHSIALETGSSQKTYASYPKTSGQDEDSGVFKKSPISIDKQAGKKDENGKVIDMLTDVAVGDEIEFTITVPVPTYTKNYVAPQFYITDTLTSGLKLDPTSIAVTVKNGEDAVSVVKDQDYKVFTDGADIAKFSGMKEDTEGFVVQFLNDNPNADGIQDGFLYTVVNAPVATVTYKATVTTQDGANFAQQINQMDNTAKLIYSRDPNFIPDGYYKTTTQTVEVPVVDPGTGEPVLDPVTHEPQTTTVTKTVNVPDDSFKPDDPTNKVKKDDPSDPESPTTPEPTGKLEDKTRHYTYDIDADVLGRDQSKDKVPGTPGGDPGQEQEDLPESDHDKTSELRKVWMEADGTVITQDKLTNLISKNGDTGDGKTLGAEYDGKEGEYGWLEGAEFSLKQIKQHTVTIAEDGKIKTEMTDVANEIKFDATSHVRVTSGGENPKSDKRGYIPMKGLDAGVYELTEIRAPLGFAFNPNLKYTITITPTYVLEPGTPDNGKSGGDDLILSSYTVTVTTKKLDENLNPVSPEETITTTCTYNLKKVGDDPVSLLKEDGTSNTEPTTTPGANPEDPATVTPGAAGIDTTVSSFAGNTAAMVYNQKLGILPSTGGSGLLFYLAVGGGFAGIALVLMNRLKKASTMV